MRLSLAAACAALALLPVPANAVASPSVAVVPLERHSTAGPRALVAACTWDGAALVGVAHSVAVPQTDALDINIRCTLTDRWGNVLAHAARGAANPPVVATAVATPANTPYRLCGSAAAYFRGGYSLSASGCGNAVPGV